MNQNKRNQDKTITRKPHPCYENSNENPYKLNRINLEDELEQWKQPQWKRNQENWGSGNKPQIQGEARKHAFSDRSG